MTDPVTFVVPGTPARISVPTEAVQSYWDVGWAYVCPDFDRPNFSILEWLSAAEQRMPILSEAAE